MLHLGTSPNRFSKWNNSCVFSYPNAPLQMFDVWPLICPIWVTLEDSFGSFTWPDTRTESGKLYWFIRILLYLRNSQTQGTCEAAALLRCCWGVKRLKFDRVDRVGTWSWRRRFQMEVVQTPWCKWSHQETKCPPRRQWYETDKFNFWRRRNTGNAMTFD